MTLNVTGLGHIALRVTDLARAKAFYTETLGFHPVVETEDLLLVNGYGLLLGMRGNAQETPQGDHFDPYRVGLDHVALAVADRAALDGLKDVLDAAGVRHNGVEEDALTHASYISFYDPDGIAWEFYFLAQPGG